MRVWKKDFFPFVLNLKPQTKKNGKREIWTEMKKRYELDNMQKTQIE